MAKAQETLTQGSGTLGTKQTAFDAEVVAIEEAVKWFEQTRESRTIAIHTDSTGAIARDGHTGAGPGQAHAVVIGRLVRA